MSSKSPEQAEYEQAMAKYYADMRQYEEELLPAYLASVEGQRAAGSSVAETRAGGGGGGGGGGGRSRAAAAASGDASLYEMRHRAELSSGDLRGVRGCNPLLGSGGAAAPGVTRGARGAASAAGRTVALEAAAGLLQACDTTGGSRRPPGSRFTPANGACLDA